jgi:RimJ/RimL family protein N-acetyltransferase
MPKDRGLTLRIIASSDLVILCGWQASDVDHLVRWWTQGEWLLFDAPWEDENWNREWFMQQFKSGKKSWFSGRAAIATPEGIPLGWVNRSGEKENPHEGRQREVRQWQGEWLDLVLFGRLQEEWHGGKGHETLFCPPRRK